MRSPSVPSQHLKAFPHVIEVRIRVPTARHFDWERIYDADSYIELLNTFSGHIAMEDWKRERLYAEIRLRVSRHPDRAIRRHWGTVLHIARRRDQQAQGQLRSPDVARLRGPADLGTGAGEEQLRARFQEH
jgi:hypothetical protein